MLIMFFRWDDNNVSGIVDPASFPSPKIALYPLVSMLPYWDLQRYYVSLPLASGNWSWGELLIKASPSESFFFFLPGNKEEC